MPKKIGERDCVTLCFSGCEILKALEHKSINWLKISVLPGGVKVTILETEGINYAELVRQIVNPSYEPTNENSYGYFPSFTNIKPIDPELVPF